MAKRYFSFEDLSSIEGEFKPSGTLGYHALIVNRTENRIFVSGKSSNGTITPEVEVRPGEVIGYDCGEIWKVPAPESYKNPIRRLLADRKLPQASLLFADRFFCSETPYNTSGDWVKTERGSCNSEHSKGTCAVLMGASRNGERIDQIVVNPTKKHEALIFLKNYFEIPGFIPELNKRQTYERSLKEIAEKAKSLLEGGNVSFYDGPLMSEWACHSFSGNIKGQHVIGAIGYRPDYDSFLFDPEDQKVLKTNPKEALKLFIERHNQFVPIMNENFGDTSVVEKFRKKRVSIKYYFVAETYLGDITKLVQKNTNSNEEKQLDVVPRDIVETNYWFPGLTPKETKEKWEPALEFIGHVGTYELEVGKVTGEIVGYSTGGCMVIKIVR